MAVLNRIAEFHADMKAWRQRLHAHPELSYHEFETARFVAETLRSFGVEVHLGLAGTGVIGVLHGSRGEGPSIALRADMDALAIQEETGLPHASQSPGVMHACGHDGHTAMLLGAARYLAESRNFAGTAHFVFQPAEEMGGEDGGAARMMRDGLFERFPSDRIFGVHNWPGMPVGSFAVKAGPMMASGDSFAIRIIGSGGHAAQPQKTVDPVHIASHVVLALQAITSRGTDPLEAVVVSCTQMHGGDAYNVIPNLMEIRGTVRVFDPAVRSGVEPRLRRIVAGICASFEATAEISYTRDYPTLVNEAGASEQASAAADEVFGPDRVDRSPPQTMIVEDFAFMLKDRPGCYGWIGNGSDSDGRRLHSSRYDFNDDALPFGASYFARLVEMQRR